MTCLPSGGTLDVTAHKLLAGQKIAELYHANGGDLGGSQVDNNFIQLLNVIFGDIVLDRFKMECPADWLQMLVNFERVKRSVNPGNASQSSLPISYEFAECYQTVTGKSIKTSISDKHKGDGI